MPEKHSKSDFEGNFWGDAILSGGIEKWERQAHTKAIRWSRYIRMAYVLKRLFDIFGSLCAIAISSPVTILTCIAIKLDDGGPVLFKQVRVGEGGKLFEIWKFRSMVLNADQIKDEILEQNQHDEGVTFKMKDDPRITKPGKWIRKLSIDEFRKCSFVL